MKNIEKKIPDDLPDGPQTEKGNEEDNSREEKNWLVENEDSDDELNEIKIRKNSMNDGAEEKRQTKSEYRNDLKIIFNQKSKKKSIKVWNAIKKFWEDVSKSTHFLCILVFFRW